MKLRFIYTILNLLTLFSCEKGLFVDSEYSTKEIDVPHVSNIAIYDDLYAILIPDTIFKIEVYGPEQLLEKINTDTVNQFLEIRNNNHNAWLNYNDSITVYVHFASKIVKLETHNTGNIYCSDTLTNTNLRIYSIERSGKLFLKLNTNNLSLNSNWNTSTTMHLSGYCKQLSVWHKGKGSINALNLISRNITIKYESSNNSYFNCKDKLEVNLYGAGNVYYSGRPNTIVINTSGDGKVKPLK